MNGEMLLFYKNSIQGKIEHALCSEYQRDWKNCKEDKEKLFCLALRRQSLPYLFTYSTNGMGLSEDYLLTEYKDYINGQYIAKDVDGVEGDYTSVLYVGDNNEDIETTQDTMAFMYYSGGILNIKQVFCPTLYVGCGSNLNISCEGFNAIRIMLFDSSSVYIDNLDIDSSVLVYKYSKEAEIIKGKYCLGDVKEFDKMLRI